MKTTDRTCALCSAFDAEAGDCHRLPAKPWPKMEPDDWCEQWTAKKDATGWRSDWPHREALETAMTESPGGLTVEALCEKIEHPNTTTAYAALAHLRLYGYTYRRGSLWFWNDEEAEPPAPPSSAPHAVKPKTVRRTYTEQEFLSHFPFGIKAALPLPVIRKKVCMGLCISEARFSDERFNLLTQGLIQKVTLPNGEDRYFR